MGAETKGDISEEARNFKVFDPLERVQDPAKAKVMAVAGAFHRGVAAEIRQGKEVRNVDTLDGIADWKETEAKIEYELREAIKRKTDVELSEQSTKLRGLLSDIYKSDDPRRRRNSESGRAQKVLVAVEEEQYSRQYDKNKKK